MSPTGGIVLYGMIWFLTVFILLPIGYRSQEDAGEIVPGTPASAPHTMHLGRKMLWATVISALIWGVIAYLILGDIITREDVEQWDQIFRS